jgi:hypothetical protein
MATITIENVPESIVKTYGEHLSYERLTSSFIPKKRRVDRLKGLSKEEVEKHFYDGKNETYWPFKDGEAITFLEIYSK